MIDQLSYRCATNHDLPTIIALLRDDELGAKRESENNEGDLTYFKAFERIRSDPNHYLMVVELHGAIVATCHLTMMPSLTFQGALRMSIEAVRVADAYRAQGIGEWMIRQAIEYGKEQGVSIVQLTTHKSRHKAKSFYERLNFEATHEGMKLVL